MKIIAVTYSVDPEYTGKDMLPAWVEFSFKCGCKITWTGAWSNDHQRFVQPSNAPSFLSENLLAGPGRNGIAPCEIDGASSGLHGHLSPNSFWPNEATSVIDTNTKVREGSAFKIVSDLEKAALMFAEKAIHTAFNALWLTSLRSGSALQLKLACGTLTSLDDLEYHRRFAIPVLVRDLMFNDRTIYTGTSDYAKHVLRPQGEPDAPTDLTIWAGMMLPRKAMIVQLSAVLRAFKDEQHRFQGETT